MEWMLKKSKIFAIAGLIMATGIGSQSASISDHSPKLNVFVDRSFTDNKVNLPDDCSGRSDYPHKSRHQPGRVNVIAETICPGQKVSIRSTLTRPGWFIFTESVTQSKSDFGKVRVSVSMPCKWKPGDPPIGYIVMSVHTSETGGSAITRIFKRLKC
jgi:hypothetical protein